MTKEQVEEMLFLLKRIADAVSYNENTKVISISESLVLLNENLKDIAEALDRGFQVMEK